MPDLLAGTIISALDTPPAVEDVETGSFTFNANTYGIDADAGSYADCGVAFIACTTGRALVSWKAQFDHDTGGGFVAISPVIREGTTVGSGTVFLAAADDRAIISAGTELAQMGMTELVTGLTPGTVYNVRLEHLQSGGIGTLLRRWVCVAPAS